MSSMKFINGLLFFLMISLVTACGPKPWPEDALGQLIQSGALSDESKMVFLLTNTSENQYLTCVLETYKQSFPDYADFEETAKSNSQQIRSLRISCIKKFAGNDINSVWNLIDNNEGIKNLKNQFPDTYYLRYKTLMMTKIINEFQTMSNFIDRLTVDESSVTTFISNLDNECGDIIANEIRIEQEKIAQEEQNLSRLNNLFDDYLYDYGNLSFWNKTSKTIILAVGYYYYGQKWSGWVSQGWWNILPGEKAIINIPLNQSGYLNSNVYYCAKKIDSIGWEWSGDNSFLVMDKNFKIPNADKYETLSLYRAFRFNSVFKKIEIGRTKEYNLQLIE